MSKEHRIAAAAIVIQEEEILLVRYDDRHGSSFLVGPGGGVDSDGESITQALVREVKEESGIEVRPHKLLFVEDLLWSPLKNNSASVLPGFGPHVNNPV